MALASCQVLLTALSYSLANSHHGPYTPQRGQHWHQNSWEKEWHPHAGGSRLSLLLDSCGCSEESE